jgi:hypothetical protein
MQSVLCSNQREDAVTGKPHFHEYELKDYVPIWGIIALLALLAPAIVAWLAFGVYVSCR